MFLSDVKRIVDLNRSEWDKAKSAPTKGNYEFTKKVYVEKADYLDAQVRPPYKFKWNRYEPRTNYKEVRDWQIKLGASFVTTKDPWWPEGVPPDSEKKYVFGDAVLMKIPLRQYLEEKERNRLRAERATASKMREFKDNLVRRTGKDAIDEKLIREHLE